MEAFSALLAICAGNSPVSGEFSAQRPVTRSFDVFFDLCPNKRLSKQSWGWWFETPSDSSWRHSNDMCLYTHNMAMWVQKLMFGFLSLFPKDAELILNYVKIALSGSEH